MAQPQFLLSPEALSDLENIAGYIALESGPARAEDVVARIERTLRTLAFMPGIGRQRRELDGNPFLFPIPPWIVFYELATDLSGIVVLRIYDGRRDPGSLQRDYKRPE